MFLSLFAIAPLSATPPIRITYSASFSSTDPAPCSVCHENNPEVRSYQICDSYHTSCGLCLVRLFNSITRQSPIVNFGLGAPNTLYADVEVFSKCPSGQCPLPIKLKIESSGFIPHQVVWINYTPGQPILVLPQEFVEKLGILFGHLDDGTVAYFRHVTPNLAQYFIQTAQEVHTTILNKRPNEDSHLYLECTSSSLQTLTARIDSIDAMTGVLCGHSTSSIRIHFHGTTASVGDIVTGYFHSEEEEILNCTPYQIGQQITFAVAAINPHYPSWRDIEDEICGWLDNKKTLVEFIPDPAHGGSSAYRIGDIVAGIIQKIHAPVETKSNQCLVILDCIPNKEIIELS